MCDIDQLELTEPQATAYGFLQEMLARPDDPAPRLAFADWLEGRGSMQHAEIIRGVNLRNVFVVRVCWRIKYGLSRWLNLSGNEKGTVNGVAEGDSIPLQEWIKTAEF